MDNLNSLYKRLGVIGILSSAGLLAGAYLIAPQEGVEYYPYHDSVGILTVCRGHTGKDIQMRKYSEEECDEIYAKDIKRTEDEMNPKIKVSLNDYQKASFISFAFNVGNNNFKTSTLLKKLNNKEYESACKELSRWVYAQKKDCRVRSNNCYGIVTRRQVEYDWCMGKYEVVDGELRKIK